MKMVRFTLFLPVHFTGWFDKFLNTLKKGDTKEIFLFEIPLERFLQAYMVNAQGHCTAERKNKVVGSEKVHEYHIRLSVDELVQHGASLCSKPKRKYATLSGATVDGPLKGFSGIHAAEATIKISELAMVISIPRMLVYEPWGHMERSSYTSSIRLAQYYDEKDGWLTGDFSNVHFPKKESFELSSLGVATPIPTLIPFESPAWPYALWEPQRYAQLGMLEWLLTPHIENPLTALCRVYGTAQFTARVLSRRLKYMRETERQRYARHSMSESSDKERADHIRTELKQFTQWREIEAFKKIPECMHPLDELLRSVELMQEFRP